MLAEPGHIADVNNITDAERAEAETQTSDAVKAAILMSGAKKLRYGGLKNDLGNNYLTGTDQYPDTTDKARVLLGNYKPPRQQQRHQPRDDGGVAFIHRGRGDSGGCGRDDREGRSGGKGRGNANTVSTICEERSVARSNCNGETHCFHCGEEGHWAKMCPLLLGEQQSHLQMNIVVEDEASDDGNKDAKEKGGFMGIQVSMLQGKEPLSIGITSTTALPSQPSKLPSISVTSRPKKRNAGELQRWDHKDKPKRGVWTS